MKKTVFTFLLWFIPFYVSFPQIVLRTPLSGRQTYYNIDAILDTVKKAVEVKMETYWVNKSTDFVRDIQMHTYLNAFKSNRTTFYKTFSIPPDLKKSDQGWIDILSISDGKGNDLKPLVRYISPDDGNINDSTVLQIVLPQPVDPGDTVFLKISFLSKLPSRIIRTGYADDFYFVAQWFPKFGVYEPAGMRYASGGGWNCHQFHSDSEFYSNHSVYDVKITVPESFVVGSGGMLVGETKKGRNLKTLTYRAEDIVDFAWTAWPEYKVFTDQWKHVKITLLLPPDRTDQAERQLNAVKNALEYLTDKVGPFPWPYLTFADPPSKGNGAGGMEYTTLFTSASFTGVPDFLRLPEMVTVHEFGHAYFMGILASNEFEEPWLDEGVNQFWESRIMDNYYGERSSLLDHPLLKISDRSLARASYVYSGSRQVASNEEFAWNYPHGSYPMLTYNKTAVWLRTLMGLTGEDTMDEIFREYYRRWAFRHPSGKDFVAVVNDVVGKREERRLGTDMNWFFDQALYGTGICDYKVSAISNSRIYSRGVNNDSLKSTSLLYSENDSLYRAVVELERIGEIQLPVELRVRFKNGDEVTEHWDGRARYKDFHYTGRGKVEWAKIDPDFRIPMDVNYINNSMTLSPDRMPIKRLSSKLQLLVMYFISSVTF